MPETPQFSTPSGRSPITTPAPNAQSTHAQASANRTVYAAELRAARGAGVRWRRIARWMGLGIFILGAVLLVFVFWEAFQGLKYYSKPDRLSSDLNIVSGQGVEATIVGVVAVYGAALMRVLYLLLLGFIASAVAARGIQFFAASEAIIDEAVLPDEEM